MADPQPADPIVDSDEEDFEDALETIPMCTDFTNLETAIDDTNIALHLFLNNKFSEAEARMKPCAELSMYHSLGYGTILFVQAIMTFDPRDIEAALDVLKHAVIISSRHRKHISMADTITKMVRRPNYDLYTDFEIHAELCYAEGHLLRALLTFIQDENLISFVKGGLKIRSCYQSYKECLQILRHRTWNSDFVKRHFESGVRMGVGSFNLLISILPNRVLKLLEFIGFSGNRAVGLNELHCGQELKPGLRGPLCALILILYHTILTFFLGQGDGDLEYAATILNPLLKLYPQGVLFLFFAGRIEEIQGNMDEAIDWFQQAVASQKEWRQFQHLCYWELLWCHCYKKQWKMASHYSDLLLQESRWSKATYSYQKAAFLCMIDDLDPDSLAERDRLMNEVPSLRQRIAGKSIPMEKFCDKKSVRFLKQNGKLIVPALELVYVWNGFIILGKKRSLINEMLELIEKTLVDVEKEKDTDPFYYDNYCLLILLKGMCFKYMDSPLQADACFREVWQSDKKLKEDLYLAPYALFELGVLCLDNGQFTEAMQCLEMARSHYKGYSLESRLHFRVHSAIALMKLKEQERPEIAEDALIETNSSPISPVHIVPQSNNVKHSVANNINKNGVNGTENFTFDTRL